MKQVPIKVKKMHPDAVIPQYQTDGSAGFDLHAVEDVVIEPGETKLIRTGLAFEIPQGYELQVRPRSGVSAKTALRIANSPGTIDSDYRGEVSVIADNTATLRQAVKCIQTLDGDLSTLEVLNGGTSIRIRKGNRIAQCVIQAVPQAVFEEVDELKATERGTGGFGSTGVGA